MAATGKRTLLRGGVVVDGTGAPGVAADVLVEDGRVAVIAPDLTGIDADVLEVSGRVVAPGFVDIHSHADATVLAFPGAESAVRQGITTTVVGNCGSGLAPNLPEHDFRRVAFLLDEEWGIDTGWRTFGDYLDRIDGTAVNIAALAAHGAVRNAVMGMEAREATRTERGRMLDLVAEAMASGAVGLSTGLEYMPGSFASADEIAEQCAIVARHDGMYATHMRSRGEGFAAAVDEAIDIARRTGVRLQLSHVAPRPYAPQDEARRAFEAIEAARAEGLRVEVDTFPEIWGPGSLEDLLPEAVMRGEPAEVLPRLASAEGRRAVAASFAAGDNFLIRAAGWDELYLAANPCHPEWIGRSLPDLAAERRTTVAELCCDLLLEAGDELASVAIRHVYATEDDLRHVLSLPYCSLGSDGVISCGEGRHAGCALNASSYGYAARTLGHYVREVGLLGLEEACHRLSGLPASMAGLHDRGELRAGKVADVVVFDPERIADRTTPDDPARHPVGIDLVLVGGEPVAGDAASELRRPGGAVRPTPA